MESRVKSLRWRRWQLAAVAAGGGGLAAVGWRL